jgi:hypothetical protein
MALGLFCLEFFNGLSKLRQYLEGIAHNTIIGGFEKGSFRVGIDYHDGFRTVDASQVLNCPTDSGGDIQVGANGYACLPNVFVVWPLTNIRNRPRTSGSGTQFMS